MQVHGAEGSHNICFSHHATHMEGCKTQPCLPSHHEHYTAEPGCSLRTACFAIQAKLPTLLFSSNQADFAKPLKTHNVLGLEVVSTVHESLIEILHQAQV